MINRFLKQFKVNDAEGAKILGVRAGNFSEWKSGKREIPPYIKNSIETLLDLSRAHQKRIKDDRL